MISLNAFQYDKRVMHRSLFFHFSSMKSTVASGSIINYIQSMGSIQVGTAVSSAVGTIFNCAILTSIALWVTVHLRPFISLFSFSEHGFVVISFGLWPFSLIQ